MSQSPRQTTPIESPCVLVCALDKSATYCVGCGRHRREIMDWTRYSDAERTHIMAQLPKRMRTLKNGHVPRRSTKGT